MSEPQTDAGRAMLDDLGAAWAEAEAALPRRRERWSWGVSRRHYAEGEGYFAWADDPDFSARNRDALGPTPAAALRALAALLREERE